MLSEADPGYYPKNFISPDDAAEILYIEKNC